jgi:hypothetical protein
VKIILVQEGDCLKMVSVSNEFDIEQFAKERFDDYLIVEDTELISDTEEPWKLSDGVLLKRTKKFPTQEQIDALRLTAYQSESDPLFFKYQRGEIEKQVWLDKVEEIRQRYPDVE